MNKKAIISKLSNDNTQRLTNASDVTHTAELEYLSELLPQMRKMALGIDEPILARLLEMAMLEAQLQYELNLELEAEAAGKTA